MDKNIRERPSVFRDIDSLLLWITSLMTSLIPDVLVHILPGMMKSTRIIIY